MNFAGSIMHSNFFLGAGVTDYFFQSNFAGQVIVVVLIVMSVMAWAVMYGKYIDLVTMNTLNERTAKAVSKAATLIDVAGDKSLKGPFASMLRDAVTAWGRAGIGNETPESRGIRMGYVENAMQRALARLLMKYENKMTWLGTIISGAPFLGLLGTAWGVMDSFGALSGQTSVTLQQLAPGVAGALLTTVAGLLVAIPSVFGYNYLAAKARTMSTELENFASLIADKIEMEANAKEAPAPIEKPKPVVRERIVEKAGEAKTISFSLDDDDDEDSSPVPPRAFE